MIMQSFQAALADPYIRVRYTGKYDFAAAVLDVSAPAAPVFSLGVSNTSLADAVTNKATVLTGDTTLTLRDLVASIKNWSATTTGHDVLQGKFEAELMGGIYTDVFGGGSSPYESAASSLNLKGTWQEALINDDNVSGLTNILLPPPSVSRGAVAIKNITGHPGTSGTPTVTRTIYDLDGNSLWSTGAIATATDALLNTNVPTFVEPIAFASGPVVVRDSCSNVAHNIATTLTVTWATVSAPNRSL